jgi:hypothetical protein
MSKILKPVVIAALLASGASFVPASAQIRTRPVLAPTGPVKPAKEPVKPVTEPVKQANVAKVKPLTKAELEARIKPAPNYLSMSELKGRIPPSTATGAIPDLKSAFTLTPAVQNVAGRGNMKIDGQIYLPDPSPPGFTGQAIIRRVVTDTLGIGGGVFLELNTAKDTFYILDCLAAMRGKRSPVLYAINAGPDALPLEMSLSDGRFILTVPQQKTDGITKIAFFPQFYLTDVKGPEMDFWGCQISTGS